MPEDNKNTTSAPKADTTPKPTGSPSNNASETPKPAEGNTNENTAKNPVPGPQSTKSLVPGASVIPDNGELPHNPASDNTPAASTHDDPKAPELSRDEEAELERILDNEDVATDPNRDEVTRGQTPSAVTKLQRLVTRVPADTPNEHTVWGAGGVTLTVGDLRELVRSIG